MPSLVDFSYAFGEPHRLCITKPDRSVKTLLDASADGLAVIFGYNDLTRGYPDFQNAGKLEVITCPATHMILPLFRHSSETVRAQVQTACRQYEKAFGRWPRGIWLSENAFTPGLDEALAAEGLKWFLLNDKAVLEGDTRPFFDSANPVLTPAEVENILETTADDLGTPGYDTSFGFGRVNAMNAVLAAIGHAPLPDSMPPTCAVSFPTDGSTLAGTVTPGRAPLRSSFLFLRCGTVA